MKGSQCLVILGALGLVSASFAALAGPKGTPPNVPATSSDPAAQALVQRVADKVRSLKSVSAEFVCVFPHPAGQQGAATAGSLKLMRPNLARIEVWQATFDAAARRWKRQAATRTQASDGASYWTYTVSTKQL